MLITRTDPFRSLDRTFDELMNATFRPVRARRVVPFTFDAAWTDGDLVVTVDLPGVPTEAVSVHVAERTLTVGVQRPAADGTTTDERSLRLGSALDPAGITARYEYGRLTITVPAAKAPEPRAVRIEVATPADAEPAVIEAATTSGESSDAPADEAGPSAS